MNAQEQAIKKVPELVGEWIDEEVLPELADGTRTARQIVLILHREAEKRLNEEMDDTSKVYNLSLIDSWVVTGLHLSYLYEYIRYVFDSWEEQK